VRLQEYNKLLGPVIGNVAATVAMLGFDASTWWGQAITLAVSLAMVWRLKNAPPHASREDMAPA